MPKFTRYLYDVCHVVSALSAAIIAQSDFDEVLFWADELYSSGFPEMLTAVIWSCFYGHSWRSIFSANWRPMTRGVC